MACDAISYSKILLCEAECLAFCLWQNQQNLRVVGMRVMPFSIARFHFAGQNDLHFASRNQ